MIDSDLEGSPMFWFPPPPGMAAHVSNPVPDTGYSTPLRKERILVIPVIHLMGILSGSARVWLPDQIPADCFPLRTFQDESTHSICIVVGHPSFPPAGMGELLPKFELLVTYPYLLPAARTIEEPAHPVDETLDNREV